MHRYFLLIVMLMAISNLCLAQTFGIGTNSPDTSARVELRSNSKGVLFPRLDIQSISSPAKGLLAFDNTSNDLMINKGSSSAANWQSLSGESAGWNLQGNAGTNPAVNFVGSKDHERLVFRIRNNNAGFIDSTYNSTSFGYRANNNYSGGSNTSFGYIAMRSNTESVNSVAFGSEALQYSTVGFKNTAFGTFAVWLNSSGVENVGIGLGALSSNKVGGQNTAVGYLALEASDPRIQQTGVGSYALKSGAGLYNTGFGYSAMYTNTDDGGYNTVFGMSAMYNNEIAGFSAAVGVNALFKITTGTQNEAIGLHSQYNTEDGESNYSAGWNSLANNIYGSFNVAVGDAAAMSSAIGEKNTAIGSGAYYASTGANTNTMFGYHAGFSKNLGWNNTLIGAESNLRYDDLFNSIAVGVGAETGLSNMGIFGNNYTSSIGGPRAWSIISDGRYKKDIRENVKGLEFIMRLRPVTYRFDMTALQQWTNPELLKKMDERMQQSLAEQEKQIETGFIAQEVEQAARETGYDFNGVMKPGNEKDHYRVNYDSFVVPLIKGMQEQQAQIEALQNNDREQWNKLNQVKQRLEKLERW